MALVDLNSDVGEGFGTWSGGPDEELLALVTSANVACGFHAGDPSLIRSTCAIAARNGVAVGAQVSYPDLAGFGRRFLDMAPNELRDAVVYQIGALGALARVEGTAVGYVKPHGALYNAIVRHEQQAEAVAGAVAELGGLPLLGLPGSAIERACAEAGVEFVVEGFADRAYRDDGTLVPRSEHGALILEPQVAAAQALRLVETGCRSICVHSDTPGAVAIMTAVRAAVVGAGHVLAAR
ncbi:MAG: hypothetical protein RJB65_1371 [Actinomycetota bacterium]